MRATRNATKGTPPSGKKTVKETPGKGTPKVEKNEGNEKLDVLSGETISNEKHDNKSEVAGKVQTVMDTENAAAKTLDVIAKGVEEDLESNSVEESITKTEISIVTMQVDIIEDEVEDDGMDDTVIEKAEEDDEDGDEEDDEADDEEDEEDADEDDNGLVEAMPVTEKQKRKKLEVFVGGLNKEATVDDVKKVFESVGDVQEVRMTINPDSGKNKGYAFVCFATSEQATRAATELDRTKILDKECAVVPSEENDTLFVGNICKSWSSEQVTEKLNEYGVEGIDEMILAKEPDDEHNRGHVFLEFVTHSDAIKAFKRLSKPDAIFGCDRSARVAWAEGSNEPDEILMAKVKSVFVGGLPEEWEKGKIEEHFGRFGDIERVVLAKNIAKSKRNDYAFVNFATRDAALASIEALNNSELTDGDAKVSLKVELAKPPSRKKRNRGHRGSYPVGGRPSKQKKGGKKKGEGGRGSQMKSKAMKRKAQEDKSPLKGRPRDKQNRESRNPRARPAASRSNTGGRAATFSRRGRNSTQDGEDYMPLGARIAPGYNAVRGYNKRPSRGAVYPPRAERGVPYAGLGTGAKRPYAALDEEAAYYGTVARGYPRARLEYGADAIYSDPLRGPSLAHSSLGHTLPRGYGYSTLTGAPDYGRYGSVGADLQGAAYPPAYFGSRGGSGAYY